MHWRHSCLRKIILKVSLPWGLSVYKEAFSLFIPLLLLKGTAFTSADVQSTSHHVLLKSSEGGELRTWSVPPCQLSSRTKDVLYLLLTSKHQKERLKWSIIFLEAPSLLPPTLQPESFVFHSCSTYPFKSFKCDFFPQTVPCECSSPVPHSIKVALL